MPFVPKQKVPIAVFIKNLSADKNYIKYFKYIIE